jgi:hypothetical protein
MCVCEREIEAMITGPRLIIISTFYTRFAIILFSVIIKYKNTLFAPLPIKFCIAYTTWLPDKQSRELGTQTIVFYYKLLERIRKSPTFPPIVWYKPSSHPCGENYAWCINLRLESQLVVIQEVELLPLVSNDVL